MFTSLGFKVLIHNNLTAAQIRNELRMYSKKNFVNDNALVSRFIHLWNCILNHHSIFLIYFISLDLHVPVIPEAMLSRTFCTLVGSCMTNGPWMRDQTEWFKNPNEQNIQVTVAQHRVTRICPWARPVEGAQEWASGGQAIIYVGWLGQPGKGTWAHPPAGPTPAGGVIGVRCIVCWAAARGGDPAGQTPGYQD